MITLFAIEITIVAALIIGFINEDKVARFERKIIKKIRSNKR